MKRHEEEKIIALLNYLEFLDNEIEAIIDTIDNANRSSEDLINLMYNIKNDMED